MPIYEYHCKACGHALEAFQKQNESVLIDCPHCGKPQLEKIISSTNFQLKGSGWYVTDFRDGNKKKPADKTPDLPSSKEPVKESKSTDTATETSSAKPKDSEKGTS
jgi:putative FmdB family regulatory protein